MRPFRADDQAGGREAVTYLSSEDEDVCGLEAVTYLSGEDEVCGPEAVTYLSSEDEEVCGPEAVTVVHGAEREENALYRLLVDVLFLQTPPHKTSNMNSNTARPRPSSTA